MMDVSKCVKEKMDLAKEVDRLRMERLPILAALSWLLYLHHGIGRATGPPDDSEWKEALDNASAILDKAKAE